MATSSLTEILARVSISDWVMIVATLFLGSVALVTPFIAELIRRWFNSAKLAIDFSHSPPYCHQTRMDKNVPVYYFRFKVINRGRIQAERCEAVLEKIWEKDSSDKFVEWNQFSPMPLKWSGPKKEQYFTIQPDREVFVDIGKVFYPKHQIESSYFLIKDDQKKLNKFFFEMPSGRPYAQWDCLIPGKYKIQVSIYSNNAKKITRKFELEWSGVWEDDPPDMLNELVISLASEERQNDKIKNTNKALWRLMKKFTRPRRSAR